MYFRLKHIGRPWMAAVLMLVSWTSCINEDLSDCGKEYSLRYDVELRTNLQTEIDTELETIEEKELGKRLKEALRNVFSDQARDIDLKFYVKDSTLNYEEQHVINSNNASYTIYLPVQDYQHLALANDDQEKNVMLEGPDLANTLAWRQIEQDTIDSYENGLFTARMKMEVKDVTQSFEVKMYMQNAAAALIIDPNDVEIKSIRGVVSHLANGFSVRDSIYHFYDDTILRAKDLGDTGSDLRCLYGVGFPSRDYPFSRTSVSEEAEGACWEFLVYITMPDDKVTETTLHVKRPLRAGNLQIIKTKLNKDGGLESVTAEVGASVELNWEEGGEYNPEI